MNLFQKYIVSIYTKLNQLLEKKYSLSTTLIAGIVIIIATRIPSFFEFWWYGDENIYLSVAHGITNGKTLYLDVWDNKPPFIYLVYAGIYSLFGTQLIWYRIVNLALSIFGLSFFYRLMKELGFTKKTQIISGICFTFLLSFGWEMTILNGENIFVPLIIAGLYFVVKSQFRVKDFSLYFGAVLLSCAGFTKAHAAIEIFWLLAVYSLYVIRTKSVRLKSLVSPLGIIGTIIVLPYIFLVGLYAKIGELGILYYSLFGFSQTYISKSIPILFGRPLDFVSNTQFKAVLLVVVFCVSSLAFYKKRLEYHGFIIFNWLAISMFVVLLSERNYPHYIISIFAPVSIAIAYCIDLKKWKELIGGMVLLNYFFLIFAGGGEVEIYQKSYYQRFFDLVSTKITLQNYQRDYNSFVFDRHQTLTPIIQNLTSQNDEMYLVANASELYPLLDRNSCYRQTTDFQFDESVEVVSKKISKNSLCKLIILYQKSPLYNEFNTQLNSSNIFEKVQIIQNSEYEFYIRKETPRIGS